MPEDHSDPKKGRKRHNPFDDLLELPIFQDLDEEALSPEEAAEIDAVADKSLRHGLRHMARDLALHPIAPWVEGPRIIQELLDRLPESQALQVQSFMQQYGYEPHAEDEAPEHAKVIIRAKRLSSQLTRDLDRRQRYAQYEESNEEKRSIEDALRASTMLLSLIEQEKLSEGFAEQMNTIKQALATRNAEL